LTMSLTVYVDCVGVVDCVTDVDCGPVPDFGLPCARTAAKSRCFLIFSVGFDPHAEPAQ